MVYMTNLSIFMLGLMAALAFVVFQIKLLRAQIRINRRKQIPLKLYGIGVQQTPTPMSFTFTQKDLQEKQNLQKIGASVCSTSALQTGVNVIKRCVMGMIWLVLTGKKILQWVIIRISQVGFGGLNQVISILWTKRP